MEAKWVFLAVYLLGIFFIYVRCLILLDDDAELYKQSKGWQIFAMFLVVLCSIFWPIIFLLALRDRMKRDLYGAIPPKPNRPNL